MSPRANPTSLWPAPDGRSIVFSAPVDGAVELWRIAVEDGDLERLTNGRHYLSAWDAVTGARGRTRLAYLRSTPTEAPDLWVQDGAREARRLTALNAEVLDEIALAEPVERRSTVDGCGHPGLVHPGGRRWP